MCGIAGVLDPSARDAGLRAVGESIAKALRHRGPDDSGIWCESGVVLAHRRLAVIDLTSAGHQPMVSPTGRYVLSYNGEIYNFRDLRRRLETVGDGFRGGSDTEVLLASIARWGVERALVEANGMFALALWDREERTLTLARDRFGEKPLYFAVDSTSAVFGSELKALRATGRQWGVDRAAVGELLGLSLIHI